jgi:hypothetical protein
MLTATPTVTATPSATLTVTATAIPMATGTQTLASTATSTLTPTSKAWTTPVIHTVTPTPLTYPPASPTTTPTPTPTPPGLCFNPVGTYPIGIFSHVLDEDGFINPQALYSDNTYKNREMRRLFLKDNTNPQGGFSWLRWQADPTSGMPPHYTASFSGTGNLDQGFDEAPWPALPAWPEPPGYPFWPHQLSPGDWIYGIGGFSSSGDLRSAIDELIINHTLMILPIVDADSGWSSGNHSHHTIRPGAFLLWGFGFQNERDAEGQKGWYLDLVSIGEPAMLPCNPS